MSRTTNYKRGNGTHLFVLSVSSSSVNDRLSTSQTTPFSGKTPLSRYAVRYLLAHFEACIQCPESFAVSTTDPSKKVDILCAAKEGVVMSRRFVAKRIGVRVLIVRFVANPSVCQIC